MALISGKGNSNSQAAASTRAKPPSTCTREEAIWALIWDVLTEEER
ncbi:capsule polysaccharide biosynthesis [Moniliophthora roreri]|uniref:Uncharacterized protein n=1 Tax=Moniliophthora roreri TaxID=221103 RepID=A0A0W0F4F9_MONRR|nr:capsule polysaccharide biosynthesis [Moniliophthora roreri]